MAQAGGGEGEKMRGSVEGDAAREAAATYCTYTHERRRLIGCCMLAAIRAHFHRMGKQRGTGKY